VDDDVVESGGEETTVFEVVYRDYRAVPHLYARVATYDEAVSFRDLCEADQRRDPRFPVWIRREGEV
jgi:hypothetical protein